MAAVVVGGAPSCGDLERRAYGSWPTSAWQDVAAAVDEYFRGAGI